MNAKEFAVMLRDHIRQGSQGSQGLLADIPRNKRPFYQQTIEQFEKTGVCYSPSGLTAQIVMMYLKANDQPFILSWEPGSRFIVQRWPEL